MLLAGTHLPKGCDCGGVMYDLVMLLMERLAQECELFFVYLYIYFNFFGGKDTGALAERCDVSGLWICQVAVKQRIGGRERNEDRAKQKENRSRLDPERELNPQGSCDCVKSFFVTETLEFSGSIRWQLVTVFGFNVCTNVFKIQKEKSSFCAGSLEGTIK